MSNSSGASSARQLSQKLFSAVKPGSGSSSPSPRPSSPAAMANTTADSTSSPPARDENATPVSLTINIPKPPQNLGGASEAPQLPKSNKPTPPATSGAEAAGASRTPKGEQPSVADEENYDKSLRERLMDAYGDDYTSVEEIRLDEDEVKKRHWKRWGPYVSERQWATVREDYSADGNAWESFNHEMSRSRAYRWGEDGIAGISDNHQRLCFTLALWNGQDRMLKERMFGVGNSQGNHGEDVKELYYYLDSTPTHSYMKFLYKYPQRAYPYEQLVEESQNRSREVSEFEITDTDAFDDDKYWDVFVEYSKDEDNADGVSIRVTAYNRGPDPADLHIIPQLFFRNTWSWPKVRPSMPALKQRSDSHITVEHDTLGKTNFYCNPSPAPAGPAKRGEVAVVDGDGVTPELLFTENETNFQRLYGGKNVNPYTKDAFHDHIIPSHRPPLPAESAPEKPIDGEAKVNGDRPPNKRRVTIDDDEADGADDASVSGNVAADPRHFVNPNKVGTKAGAHYHFKDVPPRGGCVVVRMKLTPRSQEEDPSIWDEELFDDTVDERRRDADEFYARLTGGPISDDLRSVMRQALGGMMWCKQFYQFIHHEWINGDPGQPPPPPERKNVRNKEWKHLHIADILSMPDKWEYPFFAAWDTAFHCIPLAMVDPAFAKKQLDLLTREWYMKPDGALPAYEWNFSDVNPPVHAWATFRVFKIERKLFGREDLDFLERVFQKLLLNFTWWVNRKDAGGNNVFEGGFLGLDNIGAFNRSEPVPMGGVLRQADGTAWMGFFCLNMLNMALELAKHNPTYEDIASKFFEHFLFIADAMTYKGKGDEALSLWHEEDGFFYDAIQWGPENTQQLPIHSLVGLIPLYATLTLEPSVIKRFPGFKKRMDWFIDNRPDIAGRNIANMRASGKGDRKLLALAGEDRLRRILTRMLDENEFLSDYGIRSLSRFHLEHPFVLQAGGETYEVGYWPGDSKSPMFGGNSNWRGPIWLATTFLIIESLQRFHQYYGDSFQIECPTGSGDFMHLGAVAEEIQHRIIHLFARDIEGKRACNGGNAKLDRDPHFRNYVQFHEFFHGDSGKGLGASHQTGWTGLVAYHIMQTGISCRLPRTPRTPRSTAMHYFDDKFPWRADRYKTTWANTTLSPSQDLKSASEFEHDDDTRSIASARTLDMGGGDPDTDFL